VPQETSFESAFATTLLCCPSRVSFLRGQYAHNHGVLDNKNSPRQPGGYEGFRELRLQDSTAATWAGRLKSLKSVDVTDAFSAVRLPVCSRLGAACADLRAAEDPAGSVSSHRTLKYGPKGMDPRAGKNHPHFPHTSPILSAQETHPYDRLAFRSAERIG